ELGPLTRGPGTDDAGEDAERPEERPRVDADRRVLGDVAEALLVGLRWHQARPRVVRDAVARHVLVGAGHAVAGDRAEDDLRVDLLQVLVAEAAAGEATGAHRLDDRVRVLHQLAEDLLALLGAQVEGDRALPPA